MRRRHRPLLLLGVAVGGALVTGAAWPTTPRDPLPTKTTKVNEITVEVTPRRVDERGAVIKVVLDTHQGDLDVNLRTRSRLTVGGTKWPVTSFRGDPPGGHHREGVLRFRAAGPPSGTLRLVIKGLGANVTLTWTTE